ncbi:hypothetical protein [Scleromatobacter humisilvae]|uniref:Uncharacterized protein n=1 Tax=Scleromatobacter humisilvae TaxID=2897159 RepID=A0A9X1YRH2_9BURK|nr:hypothetical protein [Scleromatobacter humisilvae]MCK9687291.1 hypothetical protein [Scleromatobacter humisilvae]
MFFSLAQYLVRTLKVVAVLLNVSLCTVFVMFVFSPRVALPLYQRYIGWGSPDFIQGLLEPSHNGAWSSVFLVLNLFWFVPMAILFAFSLVAWNVRPELAEHGAVAVRGAGLGGIGDQKFLFGIGTSAMFGIAVLGGFAILAASILTSTEFQSYAERKHLQDISVTGIFDGYRNLVRGAIGTEAAPAPSRASAASSGMAHP